MNLHCRSVALSLLAQVLAVAASLSTQAALQPDPRASVGSIPLANYFAAETARLEAECRKTLASFSDWQAQTPEYRRQLFDMLGLDPLPARTDLYPVVTGRLEQPEFTVEKLQFQSLPGLYVTANLYLPRNQSNPVPGVLYVCGHAQVKTNGVSYGNKTAYQHHGAWFARNGYVCLVIDTVQLGEIEGLHHGTYREGMWWWNSRGYTPAGVEAWNGIRALDYLQARPEVDGTRLGMTGRSGGGSYTWTVAALDDRVRAAAPVAGITDLHNQVVDGCVEGHCDCMFFVNTYRWDFAQAAALIAPRPLLIVNTDDDSIFPIDGVERLHATVRSLYAAYGQGPNLGLVIGPGGHNDTQDLQGPVMRWFNRHLKGADPRIETAAQPYFDPEALRVFATLPADQINTRIHDVWGPQPIGPASGDTLARIRTRCFRGWPEEAQLAALQPRLVFDERHEGSRLRVWDFESQPNVPLRLFTLEPNQGQVKGLELEVLDAPDWLRWQGILSERFGAALAPALPADGASPVTAVTAAEFEAHAERANRGGIRVAWLAPRGVGPSAWPIDARKWIQVRRRFMLLGQTLDGMRVWDIRAGIAVTRGRADRELPVLVRGSGGMGVNALYASLFTRGVHRLELTSLPNTQKEGPDYLNILRILDLAAVRELARSQGIELRP